MFDFDGLLALRAEAQPEFFIIILLTFLESASYSMVALIIVPYLNDLGFSDSSASWLYSFYGIITTVVGVGCGVIIDLAGIKSALIVGGLILAGTRLLMAMFHEASLFVTLLLFVLPFGSALFWPALLTGIRRCTTEKTRPFGYSLFYIILSVAMLFGGFLTDIVRLGVKHHNYCPTAAKLIPKSHWNSQHDVNSSSIIPDLSPIEFWKPVIDFKVAEPGLLNVNTNTRVTYKAAAKSVSRAPINPTDHPRVSGNMFSDSYRLLLFLASVVNFVTVPIAFFYLANFQGLDNAEVEPVPFRTAILNLKSLLYEPSFHRLFVLVALSTCIHQVHRNLEMTLPKYLMRIIGCDVSFGSIYALNQIVIIVLIPFVTALTSKLHIILTIIIGCVAISLAPFIFIFSTSMLTAVLFVLVLSIGQAFFNPRMNEYSATISPVGSEGTYLAVSHAPMFLSKFISGLSGNLFEMFCSCHLSTCEPCCVTRLIDREHPCPYGFWIWIVIGLISSGATVAIIALYSWLTRETIQKSQNAYSDDIINAISEESVETDDLLGSYR